MRKVPGYNKNTAFFYRHVKKRIAKKIAKKNAAYVYLHKLNYKVGDIVNDCDCFNHVIASIDFEQINCGRKNRGCILFDVRFTFEDGSLDCGCPGSPEPAWTVEQIEECWRYYLTDDGKKQLTDDEQNGWLTDTTKKFVEALKNGERICDERGIKTIE